MSTCPSCGAEARSDQAAFCGSCGAPLTAPRRSRRNWIIVLAALVALVGGAAAYVATRSGEKAPGRLSLTWSPGHIGSDDQQGIESDLASLDEATLGEVLDPSIRGAAEGSSLLPAGSTVALDPSTFQTAGPDIARVEATVQGSKPGRWMVYLHLVDGRWRVLGTDELP